jgi:hypothetical protein
MHLFRAEQQAEIRSLLDEFRDRARSEASGELTGSRHWASGSALADRLAVLFKHESFQEERERRLISIPRTVTELDYREGVSTLVPYYRFDLGNERDTYIHSVKIGPTPHRSWRPTPFACF